MPTYEYKCKECGNVFEVMQKFSDKPLTNCNICDGEVKKIISAGASPVFKGTGFYQTDYKSSPKNESVKKTA